MRGRRFAIRILQSRLVMLSSTQYHHLLYLIGQLTMPDILHILDARPYRVSCPRVGGGTSALGISGAGVSRSPEVSR